MYACVYIMIYYYEDFCFCFVLLHLLYITKCPEILRTRVDFLFMLIIMHLAEPVL